MKKKLENSKKIFKSFGDLEKYKNFENLITKNFGQQIKPEVNYFSFEHQILGNLIIDLLCEEKGEIITDIVTNYLGKNFKYQSGSGDKDILELACMVCNLEMIKLCVRLISDDPSQTPLDLKFLAGREVSLFCHLFYRYIVFNGDRMDPRKLSLEILDITRAIDYFCESNMGTGLDSEGSNKSTIINDIVFTLFKENKSVFVYGAVFKHFIAKGASFRIKDSFAMKGEEFLKEVFRLRKIEPVLKECYDIVSQKLFEELKKTNLDSQKVKEILAKNYLDLDALDKKSCNFLHYAAWRGYGKDVLTALVTKNNLNQKDRFGMTPILYAARNNKLETIFVLIELGADITVSNILGQTLMHYAASNGWMEVLKLSQYNENLLLARTRKGYLPIHSAASRNSLVSIKYLLSIGQDINAMTNDGSTVLHIAVKKNETKLTKYLISVGVNTNILDELETLIEETQSEKKAQVSENTEKTPQASLPFPKFVNDEKKYLMKK